MWGEAIGPWRSDEFVIGWGDLGVWCCVVDGLPVVGLGRLFCFDSDLDCGGDSKEEREKKTLKLLFLSNIPNYHILICSVFPLLTKRQRPFQSKPAVICHMCEAHHI